jgi:predicted metal-dependent peptidase
MERNWKQVWKILGGLSVNMMFGKLTPLEKLKKARVNLNQNKPFFGYLTMRLNFIEDKNITTIGVDKYGNCYYNPTFIESLTQDETNGVLCHEVMHCAFGHMEPFKDKDPDLLNISQDIVINGLLVMDNTTLPRGGLIPQNDMSIMIMDKVLHDVNKSCHLEIYDILYDNWKKEKDEFKDALINKLLDKHIRNGKEKSNNKNPANSIKVDINWEKELIEASTFAKMQGKLSAGIRRAISDLIEPEINWRGLLYKYITNTLPYDYTWSSPNKKSYATGIYMPNVVKEKIELLCSIDTSGSISKDELHKFLSELLGITNSFDNVDLKVIFNDTNVYGPYTFLNPTSNDIMELKPEGGGGTDHRPVFEWVEKNCDCSTKLIICFTDGYTSFPKSIPSIDTLWVLNGFYDKNNIPFGKVIEIPRGK